MTYPDFNNIFAPEYDEYSIRLEELIIPKWINQFEPDNSIEFNCRTILSPAPELGSKLWTQNGKRITIGVFRDEGRPTTIEPYSIVQWARYDRRLIIATSKPHYLRKDIEVELTNTCKSYIKTKVVNVFDAYKFEAEVYPSGLTSGIDGGFRHVLPINFFEEFIVFRQLPSMKLMKASEAINLINEPDPTKIQRQEHLYDLTNNKTILINTSNIISGNLNYQGSKFNHLHRQQLNERTKPLQGEYDLAGELVRSKYVSSQYHNQKTFCNTNLLNDDRCCCCPNDILEVYDYYGFPINDPTRGPYNSKQNVYVENQQIKIDIDLYYPKLFDRYGNVIVDIKDDLLRARQAVLPIQLDFYNYPIKQPKEF